MGASSGQPNELQFTVHGLPAPQGSKSFKGFSKANKAILVESSQAVKPWREDVKLACLRAMNEVVAGRWRPYTCVCVVIEFFMPRPKSQPKGRRTLPTTKPDVDKMVRSTFDALTTAGVYVDDACVVGMHIRERYVVQDESLGHPWELPGPGAVVTVFAVDPASTWADEPLDVEVRRSLPTRVLSKALADVSTESAVGAGAFQIPSDLTASKALHVVRKVARAAETADGEPVEVVIHNGVERCSAYPGEPQPGWVIELSELATAAPNLKVVLSSGATANAGAA